MQELMSRYDSVAKGVVLVLVCLTTGFFTTTGTYLHQWFLTKPGGGYHALPLARPEGALGVEYTA